MARKHAKERSQRRKARSGSRRRGTTSRRGGAARKASAAAPSEEAQFVFRGTVLQRGTATLAEVPINERTIVARVDEIVHGPEILEDYTGQPITVQLGSRQNVTEGREYVFHTTGWIFGASLAVVCLSVSPAVAGAVQRAQAAISSRSARAVSARASRAELVVSGQVMQVRHVPRQPGAPITEHDPQWQEAVVRVHQVARGSRARQSQDVTVRFAASPDVRWAKAPKFAVGQEGVWMLGDKTKEGAAMRAAASVPKNQYLVVEPEDFYPKEHGARVLSQIK